jgi:hypothetical protein
MHMYAKGVFELAWLFKLEWKKYIGNYFVLGQWSLFIATVGELKREFAYKAYNIIYNKQI